MDNRKLRVFLDPNAQEPERGSVDLPSLAQLSYAPANADRTPKMCGTCAFFRADEEQCFLHGADAIVQEGMICGRYTHGAPAAMANVQPIAPELTGLRMIANEASCRTCALFTGVSERTGSCAAAVTVEGAQAPVDALGLCARWDAPE